MFSTIAVFASEFQAVFALNFDILTQSVIICLSLFSKYFGQPDDLLENVLFQTKILLSNRESRVKIPHGRATVK